MPLLHHIKHILAAIVCVCFSNVQAQQNTVAAGGDASATTGSVAYSIGQVTYINNTTTAYHINQGVQQPIEFFTVGISDVTSLISISVFPNPVSDFTLLYITGFRLNTLTYQLFDAA